MFDGPGVYVLKLEDDKYYVGSSTNVLERFEQHKNGQGSAWTQKYPPTGIHYIYPSTDSTDAALRLLEEKVTYDLMTEFGILNVRGASICQIEIPSEEYDVIAKMLLHRQNKCIKCGQEGHYVNECPNVQVKRTGFWGWIQTGLAVAQEAEKTKPAPQKCFRCGRQGHFANSCYAKSHVNGKFLT